MEEKKTYGDQHEIVISFNKIWDNLIRYWWICAICLIVAILAGLGLSYRGYVNQKKTLQAEVNALDSKEEELEYVYVATADVYMSREETDLDEVVKNAGLPGSNNVEERSDYVALYKEYMAAWLETTYLNLDKALLYDCLALLSTDSIVEEINSQLIENGFEEYDRVYDTVSMTLGNNSRFYTLSLTGDDPDRVEFIVKAATEILREKSTEILGIENSKLLADIQARKYIVNMNETNLLEATPLEKLLTERKEANEPTIEESKILATSSVMDRLSNERKEAGEQAVKNLNNMTLSLSSLINIKTLLIIFVGIFVSFGIIFVLILKDNKIRSSEEIINYFNTELLGDVNLVSNEDEQFQILIASLEHQVEKNGIQSLLITGADNDSTVDQLMDKIEEAYRKNNRALNRINIKTDEKNPEKMIADNKKKDGLLLVYAPNINKSSVAVKCANILDQVVIAISTNNEQRTAIQRGIDNIKKMDGKILGSIMVKQSDRYK